MWGLGGVLNSCYLHVLGDVGDLESHLPDIFHVICQCWEDGIFGVCPVEHSFFSSLVHRLRYFKVALEGTVGKGLYLGRNSGLVTLP